MPAASSAAISSCARPKSIGSPPFKRTTNRVPAGRVDEALVDELLRSGVPAAALAHGDLLRARGKCDGVRMDERVVEHDVGGGEQPRGAQRQQVGRARACADEVHGAGATCAHSTIPAPTVALVASSIRMKLPVVWLSA